MKKLENLGLDHLKMVDAEKRTTWASTARRSPRTSTSLVIPTMVFVLIKASMLGATNLVSHLTTVNNVVWGTT
jgi:hypothetical protein